MYIISTLINRQYCNLLHDLCIAARAYFNKLGIITVITVVMFCVVLSFMMYIYVCLYVRLYTNYCIVIHMMWISLHVVLKTMCSYMQYYIV